MSNNQIPRSTNKTFPQAFSARAEPVIAPNPRRSGKKRRLKHRGLLRAKRYLMEQFNGLIKNHI